MLPRTILSAIWKTAFFPVLDFFAILLGSSLVYLVRYRWYSSTTFDVENVLRGSNYVVLSIGVAVSIVTVLALLGLYEVNKKLTPWKVFINFVIGVFGVLLPIIIFYLFNDNTRVNLLNGLVVSRFILASGGFFILYCLIMGRILVWVADEVLYRFGIGQTEVVVIGNEEQTIVHYLESRPHIRKVHNFHELNENVLKTITQYINSGKISEIYLYSRKDPLENTLATLAERKKILFRFLPHGFNRFAAFTLHPVIVDEHFFLEMVHTPLQGWLVVLKRVFDIVFSCAFLFLFSWLYALIALAIKLDSKGSILYMNERIGADGRVFKLFKFRRFKQEFCTSEKNAAALKVEAELIKSQNMKKDKGPLYKIENDPRMTRVGRFLEKTSLDELPQFLNVFLGTLSVVGPRPHQPREVAKYKDHHYKVLNVKPGVTGFAQINGRSDLTFEQEVFYDTYYVEHWSFWLDMWIVIKTPFVISFKRHKG
jgi:exopolysaccharide biosynthesis polyprenyl glycosylphosphotransferase